MFENGSPFVDVIASIFLGKKKPAKITRRFRRVK
jgi:hypothetical protein